MAATTELVIRPARAADADPISRLIAATLRETNARDYPPQVIEHNVANNTADIIAARIANDHVLVAERGGRLVGTASLNGDAVKGVLVDPQAQGGGIGRELIRAVERLAIERGLRELRLQSSLTAVGFYRRQGFVDAREVLFGEERTIVMLRQLR